MKKNKGIWIAIMVIILLGVGITLFTNGFVRKNISESTAAAEDRAVAAAPEAFEGGAAAGELNPGTPPGESSPGAAPDESNLGAAPTSKMRSAMPDKEAQNRVSKTTGGEAIVEAAPADAAIGSDEAGNMSESSKVLSPLVPSNAKTSMVSIEKKDLKEYYESHLSEVDAQIKKMRNESSDSTTYSMQALADKELKMWNLELNSVYSAITNVLEQDAKTALESSQQTWMKDRDSKASDAAKKYSGGSLEGVEYTASLAGSTRQRVYDLVDEYLSVLSSEE